MENSNEVFILRTLELAKKGFAQTWPNPMVGAVIVKNNKVIGEGHHHKAGLDHAEVDALKNCQESPEGATLYVNLEPCCHTHKRTPPCAQRLIQERIKKIVICNLDPNPHVNGRGVELLRSAGIEVEYGVLENLGENLNEVFFHSQRTKLPFVHLKMATSLDGKMALSNGQSQWITGEIARRHVHELRSQHQAVAIGAETLRKDNPKLNVRLENYKGEQPWRIVFTKTGDLPKNSLLFTDELRDKTIVYQNTPLKEALADLYERKIINVMLEGGAQLATNFFLENLIQRVSIYMNPSFIGHGPSALGDLGLTDLNLRPRLKNIQTQWFGEDLYLTGRT